MLKKLLFSLLIACSALVMLTGKLNGEDVVYDVTVEDSNGADGRVGLSEVSSDDALFSLFYREWQSDVEGA